MEQATDATTPTAPTPDRDPVRHSYDRARALADHMVNHLTVIPSLVQVRHEYGTDTYGVLLDMGTGLDAARAVLSVATFIDAGVSREAITRDNVIDPGFWIECRGCHSGTPVTARALTNSEQAAALTEPGTGSPAPLGASALAALPAITASPTDDQDDPDDVARCVRCRCTEERACEGGCYWVPNRQMIDLCSACATPEELQATTYTAEISDGGE